MNFLKFRKKRSQALALSDKGYAFLSILCGDESCAVSECRYCEDLMLECGEQFRPYSEEFFGTIFGTLISEHLLAKRKLRIVLPPDEVMIKVVDLENMPIEDIENAFASRLGQYFPMSPIDSCWDIVEIDSPAAGDGKKRFAAAVADRRIVENIAKSASQHNICIEFAEPCQTALERAAESSFSGFDNTLCIYAGNTYSQMIFVRRGSGIYLCELQGLSTDEICGSYSFAQTKTDNFTADCVCIFGERADNTMLNSIREKLNVQFGVAAEPFNFIDGTCPKNTLCYCALGAALR